MEGVCCALVCVHPSPRGSPELELFLQVLQDDDKLFSGSCLLPLLLLHFYLGCFQLGTQLRGKGGKEEGRGGEGREGRRGEGWEERGGRGGEGRTGRRGREGRRGEDREERGVRGGEGREGMGGTDISDKTKLVRGASSCYTTD